MLKQLIFLSALACLLVSPRAIAEEEVPADPPGKVRYDAEGNAQMWGGPTASEITNEIQLTMVLAESATHPVLLFKHSTQCPISARAAARLSAYDEERRDESPRIYWLKVIESRPVSNAAEARLGVKHESPQIILLDDAKAVWNTSHDEITAEAIDAALEALAAETPES